MNIYQGTKKVKTVVAMIVLVLGGIWVGCSKRSVQKESLKSRFSAEQLSARFPWDLGDSQIDVSSYPDEQKQAYELVAAKCGACHHLARVFNSPFVERSDWERFIKRMHFKTGKKIEEKSAKEIVDFLVYDAKVRKVSQRDYFQAKLDSLETLYQQIQQEKQRIGFTETSSPDAKMIDYTGDKP